MPTSMTPQRVAVGLERGRVTTQYTVWCPCECWYQVDAERKSRAAVEFLLAGWKRSRRWGWLCPACAKGEKYHRNCGQSHGY